MKWMNTKELVSLLKRFPNEEVEVVDYQDGSLASALFGMKADGEKCFRLTWDGETKTYSEAEVLRSYGNRYWKIVSSLFLRSEHERQIALRMVEELGLLGCLDDIIAEHGLDNVRVCEHCHRLMDEGWLVDDVRTFVRTNVCKSPSPTSACPSSLMIRMTSALHTGQSGRSEIPHLRKLS